MDSLATAPSRRWILAGDLSSHRWCQVLLDHWFILWHASRCSHREHLERMFASIDWRSRKAFACFGFRFQCTCPSGAHLDRSFSKNQRVLWEWSMGLFSSCQNSCATAWQIRTAASVLDRKQKECWISISHIILELNLERVIHLSASISKRLSICSCWTVDHPCRFDLRLNSDPSPRNFTNSSRSFLGDWLESLTSQRHYACLCYWFLTSNWESRAVLIGCLLHPDPHSLWFLLHPPS